MYAIIETGGKQYKVEEGMTLSIEKLTVDAGSEVTFDQVLFVGGGDAPKIGAPTVEGAAVTGTVLRQDKDRKILVYHKKRRKGYEKKYGHRQPYTDVAIKKISL